jgi:hypothetical protein
MAMMVMLSTAATTSQAISSRRTRRLSPLSPQQDPRRSQPKEFPSEGESHVESMSFKIQLTHTNESSNIVLLSAGGAAEEGLTFCVRPSARPQLQIICLLFLSPLAAMVAGPVSGPVVAT